MGQPWDRQAHTLAQLARRAGISEGRARALHAASPSGLPTPDRTDADGRPMWWASTIDAWCARTGREVHDGSLWLFRAPAATGPVPELQRGVVTFGGGDRFDQVQRTMFAIVWDTEQGHVIYLQPLQNTGDHKDWLAAHAAELIEPRWWSTAVVVMPLEENLTSSSLHRFGPLAYVYRLRNAADDPAGTTVGTRGSVTTAAAGGVGGGAGGGVFSGMRRWFAGETTPVGGPAKARATWEGQLDLSEISPVIGRSVPVWLAGTELPDNAEQTLVYGDRTFTCPDTVTEWPQVQRRLQTAITAEMPAQFPAGFAALAVDAAEGLQALRAAHENTADAGPGWHLVCRPARPAPDITLETTITGASLVSDLTIVAAELTELRELERDLDRDVDYGDAYYAATELLAWQLRSAAKDAGTITDLNNDFVPVADDVMLPYFAPFRGPVVEAWAKDLQELPEIEPLLRLRRIRRLLGDHRADRIEQAYRDQAGRYVLVLQTPVDGDWFLAEWPVAAHDTPHWTDKTVIAADDDSSVAALFALTSTDDATMRIDPFPLPPDSDRDAFAYGYGGGTPATTYQAIVRVALDDRPGLAGALHGLLDRSPDGRPHSQLWTAISTTKGPLRLSWPQIKLWARADTRDPR